MRKTVIIYGLILAASAFMLSWLDYRFWMRDIGPEIYGIVIAVLFAGLGVWAERQRHKTALDHHQFPNEKAVKALGLTAREMEMLSFLRAGKSNKEIARALNLSPNTIKTHLKNLFEKLGVNNRTQAVIKAADLALLPAS